MSTSALGLASTILLVIALGMTGCVQMAGPGFVRRAYVRLGLRPRSHRAMGAFQLLAACLLATPGLRVWGAAIAGVVNFIAIVVLLNNRAYAPALPGFAVQMGLLLVMLAAV